MVEFRLQILRIFLLHSPIIWVIKLDIQLVLSFHYFVNSGWLQFLPRLDHCLESCTYFFSVLFLESFKDSIELWRYEMLGMFLSEMLILSPSEVSLHDCLCDFRHFFLWNWLHLVYFFFRLTLMYLGNIFHGLFNVRDFACIFEPMSEELSKSALHDSLA